MVLIGPFGAGKSLTVREVFRRLRRDYYRNRIERIPIAINLRDHWGQPRVEEVVLRHAYEIGFDHPNQLVRAWNAGLLIPLLDGFDELASPVMAMKKDAIRKSREEALKVIQAFMYDVRGKSGVLLAGRDHYFDSIAEAKKMMRLPPNSIFVEVGEFSEEQTISYLRKKKVTHELPTWLPRKPLLLGYLASRGLLGEVVQIEGEGGVALAWDQFLDSVCRREADLSSDIDSDAVRQLLEALATRARSLPRGSGPLLDRDLADAYKIVTGNEPLEAARTLLQRLPGLTARDQEVGARSFVDDEMMEALQAGPVARYVQSPYANLEIGNLVNPMSDFACSVVSHLANQLGVKSPQFYIAAKEAMHRWSNPTLALDCILAGASHSSNGVFDAQGLVVSDGLADVIDMEERPVKNLTLSDCMIDRLRFDTLHSKIHFNHCQIVKLEGLAGSLPLPECFVACEVDEYDDRSTNAAIVRSELPDPIKVLLLIIRKLFLQRGSGRVESALSRGVDESLQKYVDPVLNVLVSAGIIYSHPTGRQTIWHGNRSHRYMMLRILEQPTDPDSPLVQAVASLNGS